MMHSSPFAGIIFAIGKIQISGSIAISWFICICLALLASASTRKLQLQPSFWQTIVEGAYSAMLEATQDILGENCDRVLPFVTALWIFILSANLAGMIPGLSSPTSDLSVTAALAFMVFLSVHWFGIQTDGWKAYLKHYITPNPILLPFHLMGEISRTLALAIRLFGNVMSLEMAIVLILMVAGFLVPIPLLILHLVEAIIQAYLFGVLALIYIAGALQSQELRRAKKGRQI